MYESFETEERKHACTFTHSELSLQLDLKWPWLLWAINVNEKICNWPLLIIAHGICGVFQFWTKNYSILEAVTINTGNPLFLSLSCKVCTNLSHPSVSSTLVAKCLTFCGTSPIEDSDTML